MNPKYTEIDTPSGSKCIVAEYEDGRVLLIPTDPANSDYQRYLNPEAEQSTPSVTNGD
jgi:hypothetical protein